MENNTNRPNLTQTEAWASVNREGKRNAIDHALGKQVTSEQRREFIDSVSITDDSIHFRLRGIEIKMYPVEIDDLDLTPSEPRVEINGIQMAQPKAGALYERFAEAARIALELLKEQKDFSSVVQRDRADAQADANTAADELLNL